MRGKWVRSRGLFVSSGAVEAGCKAVPPAPETVRQEMDRRRRRRHHRPALPRRKQPAGNHQPRTAQPDSRRLTRQHPKTIMVTYKMDAPPRIRCPSRVCRIPVAGSDPARTAPGSCRTDMFHADLHIHSRFSRACSKDCDIEHLSAGALRKGLRVLGTGDFTHPAWSAELRETLVPAEPGLFRVRPELEKRLLRDSPATAKPRSTAEILMPVLLFRPADK